MMRTEPMWMGSPSSPSSPVTQRQQNPYLPPFLMGESSYSVSSTPPVKPFTKTVSPARSSLNRSLSSRPYNSPFNNSRSIYEKDGGDGSRPMRRRNCPPPVKTLDESFSTSLRNRMDDADCINDGSLGPISASGYLQCQRNKSGGFGNMSSGRDPLSTSMANSFLQNSQVMSPSPAQLDPFYTQGESLNIGDELDETWVTIFGFPRSAESFIMQEFASFGTITNHVAPAEGNWIHVQFQNKLQAKRAISKSGKVFGGKIMIGVTQCIDKAVMEHKRVSTGISSSSSHGNLSASRADSPLTPDSSGSLSRPGKPTSMRPLTSAYKSAANDNQVVQLTGMPQKSSGIISKAMEYVLGW